MKTKKRFEPGYTLLIIGMVCLFIAGVLGFRYVRQIRHRPFPRPTETNVELIQGWMTIPYVSRTYHVSIPYVFESIQIENTGSLQKTNLDAIAKLKGISSDELISLLKRSITVWQQTKP